MDLSDERKPLLTPQEGSTMYLNDDFSLKEVTEQQEDIQEKDFKFKLDFSLPLTKGEFGNHLRFGTKVVHKTKDKEIDFYEYTPPVPSEELKREILQIESELKGSIERIFE